MNPSLSASLELDVTPASRILDSGSFSGSPPESELEAAREELCELQRCGLQIAFDRRVPKQAAKAPELPPPSPLLIFAATPGSFIPGLDSCPLSGGALLEDPSKELQNYSRPAYG